MYGISHISVFGHSQESRGKQYGMGAVPAWATYWLAHARCALVVGQVGHGCAANAGCRRRPALPVALTGIDAPRAPPPLLYGVWNLFCTSRQARVSHAVRPTRPSVSLGADYRTGQRQRWTFVHYARWWGVSCPSVKRWAGREDGRVSGREDWREDNRWDTVPDGTETRQRGYPGTGRTAGLVEAANPSWGRENHSLIKKMTFSHICSGFCSQSRRRETPSENPAQDAERHKGERTQTPGSQGAKRTRTPELTQTQRWFIHWSRSTQELTLIYPQDKQNAHTNPAHENGHGGDRCPEGHGPRTRASGGPGHGSSDTLPLEEISGP